MTDFIRFLGDSFVAGSRGRRAFSVYGRCGEKQNAFFERHGGLRVTLPFAYCFSAFPCRPRVTRYALVL